LEEVEEVEEDCHWHERKKSRLEHLAALPVSLLSHYQVLWEKKKKFGKESIRVTWSITEASWR